MSAETMTRAHAAQRALAALLDDLRESGRLQTGDYNALMCASVELVKSFWQDFDDALRKARDDYRRGLERN
jgi:hypothetical protein